MLLTDLPPDARPREMLLALGPGGVADPELLAQLLHTGSAGKSLLYVTQGLLDRFCGLAGPIKVKPEAPNCVQDLGLAMRTAISAALEMTARRSLRPDHSFEKSVLL